MKNNVIIRRQKFSIKTNSEQLALEVRKQVNDSLQYDLVNVYDQVFNADSFEGANNLFINKISLNLGRCTQSELSANLPGMLKKALLNHLHNSAAADDTISSSPTKTNAGSAKILTDTDERAAVLYYLQYGIYPWWYTAQNPEAPTQLIKNMLSKSVRNFLQQVIATQESGNEINAVNIRQRFIELLPEDQIDSIIHSLINLNDDTHLKKTLYRLQDITFLNWFSAIFSFNTQQVKKEWIDFLLHSITTTTCSDIGAAFTSFIIAKPSVVINPVEDLPCVDLPPEIHSTLLTIIEAIAVQKNNEEPKAAVYNNEISTITKKLAVEGIYIGNAGLVILHPFLQALFTSLQLIDNANAFVNNDAALKATVVLHYLQHSNTFYQEYQLAFNKILCGIPVETVVPNNIILTAADISECDELLTVVIKYWEALKGASIAAIQEMFITRQGKLSFKENYWLLQVEKQAADILIDRLPWGIGTIKLPWLQHMISIEW